MSYLRLTYLLTYLLIPMQRTNGLYENLLVIFIGLHLRCPLHNFFPKRRMSRSPLVRRNTVKYITVDDMSCGTRRQ